MEKRNICLTISQIRSHIFGILETIYEKPKQKKKKKKKKKKLFILLHGNGIDRLVTSTEQF